MESELHGGIEAALVELEQGIIAYLDYFIYSSRPKDKTSEMLWGSEKAPECPEAFLLYKKLRLYAGRDVEIPSMWSGGYGDQPHIYCLTMETCARTDRAFRQRASTEASGQ